MKIVHFSDLHLDAPFAWMGASGEAARARRQAQRDVLRRIVQLTRDEGADALLCGGDLYEQDRFSRDTGEFLRKTFADIDPIPVYIAPGNHDWYGPQSLYRTIEWSRNVHIFGSAKLEGLELADGLTLWGAAHLGPANTDGFLDGFQADGGRVNIALFHGSERTWLSEQGEGKQPHAPFDPEQIERSGLAHAFLGHFHRPKNAPKYTYPGNPDPLEFGEDGDRGAVVAEVHGDGRVTRVRHSVALTSAHELSVDVSGAGTRQEILDRLSAVAHGLDSVARIVVSGNLEADVDLRDADLRAAVPQFDGVQIRTTNLLPALDLEAIKAEQTVTGQFMRDVLASGLDPDEQRRVLLTGLRALRGQTDLDVI